MMGLDGVIEPGRRWLGVRVAWVSRTGIFVLATSNHASW